MKRWAFLCLVALASNTHAVRIKIYDLGAIGTRSSAESVNDWGMVVGNLNSSRCFVRTEQLGMFKPGPWFQQGQQPGSGDLVVARIEDYA